MNLQASEDHVYPVKNAEKEIKPNIILSEYYKIPFKKNYFDFVIGFSAIYKYDLCNVIKTLKEIDRVSKKSFITVASYNDIKEKRLFEDWTLLGTTCLHKKLKTGMPSCKSAKNWHVGR